MLPLRFGDVVARHEVVQVPYEVAEQLSDPRIRCVCEARHHLLGQALQVRRRPERRGNLHRGRCRTAAPPGILQQALDALVRQLPGVRVRRGDGQPRGLRQIRLRHAQRAQRGGASHGGDQVEHPARGVRHAQCIGDPVHDVPGCGGVVGHGVRQDHRVCLGVRQAERTAQGVAQLVVESHADGGEAGTGQPRGMEKVGACSGVGRLGDENRQGAGDPADSVEGHTVDHRVRLRRVQGLHGVGQGVDSAGDRHAHRQVTGELDVVDDGFGQNRRRGLRDLASALRLAQHRSDLGARVCGRKDHLREIGAQRQCFGQPCRGAAADSHQTVGGVFPEYVERSLGHLHRGVHCGTVELRHDEVPEDITHSGGGLGHRRAGQEQDAGTAEPLDFVADLTDRSGAEDDPRGVGGVDEVPHRFPPSRVPWVLGCLPPSVGAVDIRFPARFARIFCRIGAAPWP